MKLRILLKFLHVAGTVWLTVCAAFLLILSLRQAGAGWWLVFSVSGFSGIAFLLLMSVYLFALFRGVTRKQLIKEHPLTSSGFYLLFYDVCPLLGTLAGLVSAGAAASTVPLEWLSFAAEGALAMTFLVWIVGDPLLGLIETFLPACAAARRERLTAESQMRMQREENRRRLLEQVRLSCQTEQARWEQELLPMAQRLLAALEQTNPGLHLRQESIEIGAYAWQKGGVNCMQILLRLVNRLLQEKGMSPLPHLAFWWDGIGTWRKPSLSESLLHKTKNPC
ncbi:MAG TPA: hypothetical protein PKY88_03855 [Anaerohalosphaeraceae bacterium]|nr:hypothetical protein [Anaerohalosphaeraceae bacterium]